MLMMATPAATTSHDDNDDDDSLNGWCLIDNEGKKGSKGASKGAKGAKDNNKGSAKKAVVVMSTAGCGEQQLHVRRAATRSKFESVDFDNVSNNDDDYGGDGDEPSLLVPQMSTDSVASIVSEDGSNSFDDDSSGALAFDDWDLPATSGVGRGATATAAAKAKAKAKVGHSAKQQPTRSRATATMARAAAASASSSTTTSGVHWRQGTRLMDEARALHIPIAAGGETEEQQQQQQQQQQHVSKGTQKKRQQRQRQAKQKEDAEKEECLARVRASCARVLPVLPASTIEEDNKSRMREHSQRTRNARQQDMAEAEAAAARSGGAVSFGKAPKPVRVDLVGAIDNVSDDLGAGAGAGVAGAGAGAGADADDDGKASITTPTPNATSTAVRNLKKQVKQREVVQEQLDARRANRRAALETELDEQARAREEAARIRAHNAKVSSRRHRGGGGGVYDDSDDESDSASASASASAGGGKQKSGIPAVGETITCSDRWFPLDSSETLAQVVERAKDMTAAAVAKSGERCSICLGDFNLEDEEEHAVHLPRCSALHFFHRPCIAQALNMSARCPECFTTYGSVIGTQPPGNMIIQCADNMDLPGTHCRAAFVISYNFPSGTQGPRHPSPGRHYSGTSRVGYLPANAEGKKVLRLLMRAWDARVIFTIGQSVTTGCDNTTVWNGIHHKTSVSGGPTCFGYPDPTYLTRVQEEMAALGIV